jgi:polar amino acid transport system substrate-binding protein
VLQPPRRLGSRLIGLLLVAFLSSTVGGSAIGASTLTLDDVKKHGVLQVGMNADYPPWEYNEGGIIKGFDPDLIQILASRLGVKAQIIDTEWAGVIPALYAGKFDVVISAMAITKERSEKVNFTSPYAESTSHIAVLASSPFKKVEDLIDHTIATQLGAPEYNDITALQEEFKKTGKGFKSVLLFANMPDAYVALESRRTDAVADGLPSILIRMKKIPNKYRYFGGLVRTRTFIGIATRKPDIEVKQFFDREILDLRHSGKLAELQKKWFGFEMGNLPDQAPSFVQ